MYRYLQVYGSLYNRDCIARYWVCGSIGTVSAVDADQSPSARWLIDSAPVVDVIDDASRDSGICLMDATSGDDDALHDFSVLIHISLII